jgi:ketosteroid isomerase-like protein
MPREKDPSMKLRLRHSPRMLLDSATMLVLAVSLACSPPPVEQARQVAPEPPPLDQASVTQSINNAVAALAAGDVAKMGSGYAEDAVLVTARGKVETRTGIEAFWTEALKSRGASALALETVKWGTSGDLAYVLSRFTGGVTAGSGHVLAVVQRQPDGSLKTVAQVSIPDPPGK